MIKQKISLRNALVALVALTALPILAFSAYALSRYARSQEDLAKRELEASTRGVAHAVDARFAAVAAVLQARSSAPSLAVGDLVAFAREIEALSSTVGYDFQLYDELGNLLAASKALPAASGMELRQWSARLQPGDWMVTDVMLRADGRPYTRVVLRLNTPTNAAWTLHALVGARLFRPLLDNPGVPSDWVVSIVYRTATHLVRSHNDATFAGRKLVPVLVEHMAQRRTDALHTVTLEGIPSISAVSFGPTSGWAAAVGLPREKLLAPMQRQFRNLALASIPFLLLALGLSAMVGSYLVRSFARLERKASAIGHDSVIAADIQSVVGEIVRLDEAITEASKRLRERTLALEHLNMTLERRVVDRTAQLTASNEQLLAEMHRREVTETKLRQLERLEAVGNLAGGIAHDFNNMLATVTAALRLIQRRLRRGERDVESLIDSALDGAHRSAQLTQQLLAFSRRQTLRPEAVDVNDVVGELEGMIRSSLPSSIEIETAPARDLWPTVCDRDALINALLNLILNARDAMPEGGRLRIETANRSLAEGDATADPDTTTGDYVTVTVSDTGTGMAPEVIEQAMDPFFTTKPVGKGTGLGLSQVFGFAQQSSGHLKVESAIGEGATVRLYLPRSTERPAHRERPAASADQLIVGNGESVLVVEDNDGVRQLTLAMLAELNYATLESSSAAVALNVLDDHPDVQVILTDVVMPGMSGHDFAREVARRGIKSRLIYMTGYTRTALDHDMGGKEKAQVLLKPFTMEALAARIAATLGRTG